jgi:hypothetical protein
MTQPTVPSSAMVTFVVRFWRETSAGEPRWRGQIEHVHSGKRTDFLEIEGLVSFLEGFGIGAVDRIGTATSRLGPHDRSG